MSQINSNILILNRKNQFLWLSRALNLGGDLILKIKKKITRCVTFDSKMHSAKPCTHKPNYVDNLAEFFFRN